MQAVKLSSTDCPTHDFQDDQVRRKVEAGLAKLDGVMDAHLEMLHSAIDRKYDSLFEKMSPQLLALYMKDIDQPDVLTLLDSTTGQLNPNQVQEWSNCMDAFLDKTRIQLRINAKQVHQTASQSSRLSRRTGLAGNKRQWSNTVTTGGNEYSDKPNRTTSDLSAMKSKVSNSSNSLPTVSQLVSAPSSVSTE